MSNTHNNTNSSNKVQISKTMSWILRHGLNELKLSTDELGRISLNLLLEQKQMKNLGATKDIVLEIIESNNKQRFRLDVVDGIEMIGANQGHSIEIGKKINSEKLMKKIDIPLNLCVHGTYSNVIEKIKKSGLNRMTRTHIHFAPGFPNNENIVSGARNDTNVFIELDMEKAMNDGIIFYLSSNGVILSEGIDGVIESKYFKNIIYK